MLGSLFRYVWFPTLLWQRCLRRSRGRVCATTMRAQKRESDRPLAILLLGLEGLKIFPLTDLVRDSSKNQNYSTSSSYVWFPALLWQYLRRDRFATMYAQKREIGLSLLRILLGAFEGSKIARLRRIFQLKFGFVILSWE